MNKINPPVEWTRAAIKGQLVRQSRDPFADVLADGLRHKPTPEAWQELAQNPDKWARAISGLAKPAGFGEKVESFNVSLDLTEAVNALVVRHGAVKAAQMVELLGIPRSAVGLPAPEDDPEPAHDTIPAE